MDTIRTCISFQASTAAKVIAKLSRTRLVDHGVTPIQFAVLQAVSEIENQTSADIGAALMIDSATIVGVIDRLAAMELLAREPHLSDRRIKQLVLTERGEKQLPAMQAAMDALNSEIDATLDQSAREVRNSLQRLAKLTESLKG